MGIWKCRRLCATLAGLIGFGGVAAPAWTQSVGAQRAESTDATELQEVVVTGTSIRGIAPVGSPVIDVGRNAIDSVGARTTAELLTSVPQIAQFNAVPTGTPTFGGVVAQVSLRPNLGTGATLVLINGHRLVGSGLLQALPDTSAIPPAAIERVEVIADGASAIYGSDAVGGVINFITRRTFKGAETSARYSFASDYHGYDLSQLLGTEWSSGSLVATAQYIGHSRLRQKDLDYYTDVGGIGLNTSCGTASVGPSATGCDIARLGDLQPEDKRLSLFVNANQKLSESVDGWAEIYHSRSDRDQAQATPSVPPTAFPASNPFNTAGVTQTVFYRPITEFGESLDRTVNLRLTQGTLGLDVKLPGNWLAKAYATYGQSTNTAVAVGLNNVAYQQAMAGTTTATAFDPFLHRTSATVLSQMLDATESSEVKHSLAQGNLKVDGALFSIPGGEVRMAVGGEYRHDTEEGFRRVGSSTSILGATARGYLSSGDAKANRNVQSAFAELFVPIIGAQNNVPLARSLSLSLAGRYDHYSDVGGTTNPKIGLNWQIVDSLRVFGNTSSSFQAPALGDSLAGAIDTRVQVFFGGGGAFQPTGPGLTQYTGQNGIVIAGGSGNLVPQTSRNYAYGFELTPTAWDGFRANVTYYHVNFENFIGLPFPGIYTVPSLRQYGILAPIVNGSVVPFTTASPEVTRFTSVLPTDGGVLPTQIYWIAVLQRVNVSTKRQSGIDFDVSQRVALGTGSLTARVAGTYIAKDELAGSPGAALSDVISTDSRLRYAASLEYTQSPVGIGLVFNHLAARYSTTAKTVPISAFDLLNLHASYDLPGEGLFGGIQLQLNIDNVLDKDPPRQTDTAGGVVANLYPFGRMFTLGARKHW